MFPNPEQANPDGLLAMGGDLSPEVLQEAYTQGIFPWPQDEEIPLLWFSPPQRGVLFLDQLKVPKATRRKIKKEHFQVTFNKDFQKVIESCARVPRSSDTKTWIIPGMIEAYTELHKRGQAISVEAWRDEQLVGGLYGVLFKGVFSGESMFFLESEASKVCLVTLAEDLLKKGHSWIDIQMVTPLLEQFGGEYIPRKDFLNMLKKRHENQ